MQDYRSQYGRRLAQFGCLLIGWAIICSGLLFWLARSFRSVEELTLLDESARWRTRVLFTQRGFHPSGMVAVSDETIFTIDRQSECVWRYDRRLGLKRLAEIKSPGSIAAVGDGRVWVIENDFIQPRIKAIDSHGTLTDLGTLDASGPRELVYDRFKNRLLVFDSVGNKIIAREENGTVQPVLDDGTRFFNSIGSANTFAVTDNGSFHLIVGFGFILTISTNGDRTRSIPNDGYFDHAISPLSKLAFDPSTGLVILQTDENSLMRVIDGKCERICDLGPTAGINAVGLAVTAAGQILVCDPVAGAIVIVEKR